MNKRLFESSPVKFSEQKKTIKEKFRAKFKSLKTLQDN